MHLFKKLEYNCFVLVSAVPLHESTIYTCTPSLPLGVHLCSVVSDFTTPGTVAYQAPLSMGFFRKEYWSGLPFPSPGDLPDSGIKPGSPALQADSLPSEPPSLSKNSSRSGSSLVLPRMPSFSGIPEWPWRSAILAASRVSG